LAAPSCVKVVLLALCICAVAAGTCAKLRRSVDNYVDEALAVERGIHNSAGCCNACLNHSACAAWTLRLQFQRQQSNGLSRLHVVCHLLGKLNVSEKGSDSPKGVNATTDRKEATTALAPLVRLKMNLNPGLVLYQQCGGNNWRGIGSCSFGLHCEFKTHRFSQCEWGEALPTPTPTLHHAHKVQQQNHTRQHLQDHVHKGHLNHTHQGLQDVYKGPQNHTNRLPQHHHTQQDPEDNIHNKDIHNKSQDHDHKTQHDAHPARDHFQEAGLSPKPTRLRPKRRPVLPVPSHHPSLFCFSLVSLGTYEAGVLLKQQQLHAGLFACDAHSVLSNVTANALFGDDPAASQMHVFTIDGWTWMPARYGPHGHPHVLNTPVFQKAWDVIFAKGTYKYYDWTLKLDVDAVIVPPRVRNLLQWRPKDSHGRYKPMYILNAGSDDLGNLLHGPVEALSAAAVEAFAAGADRCRREINGTQSGEDFYVNRCMQLLKVPGVLDMRLLKDAYMWGQKHVECYSNEAVFHPLKSTWEWANCVKQIGGPAMAVSFALDLPDGLQLSANAGVVWGTCVMSLLALAAAATTLGARRIPWRCTALSCSKRQREELEVVKEEEHGLLGPVK